MFKLTLAHEPDIRLGTIALVVGIEDTGNTSDHFCWVFGCRCFCCLVTVAKIEKSEERRENEQV